MHNMKKKVNWIVPQAVTAWTQACEGGDGVFIAVYCITMLVVAPPSYFSSFFFNVTSRMMERISPCMSRETNAEDAIVVTRKKRRNSIVKSDKAGDLRLCARCRRRDNDREEYEYILRSFKSFHKEKMNEKLI